ncbi:MAG TPA: sugar ABC transporter permease, partial [Chthoniobacterales bacterium]|nr:sugar ABC transporter permease [Chthoniobacterales bacterium]
MMRRRARFSDQTFGLLLLSPAALLVLGIAVYPILRVFWLSFFAQNLGTALQPRLIGVGNYIRLVNDGHFWQSIRTTLLFTVVAVVFELLLGLAFALLLNARFRGRGLARAAALVPWALPTAVLALAWTWIFNDQFGVFNDLLARLGLIARPIAWLGGGHTALAAIVFADVWKTAPFIMIILLAGLQNIPEELYEAAAIDGARRWKTFILVTLPMLTPAIILALIFRAIHSFGIFDLIFVMTGGGPGGATETVGIYTYNTYMRYLDFGYGSAMIVVSFLILAALIGLVYWPLSRT